jgi:DNA repair protein RecO (recombination protein O)
MSTEKASAIVLRVVEWSETSSIVTLFTREFGKVRGAAKGARRPKGPFEAALDLLAVCRVVFIRKSSDALDLLTEAKLERRFRTAGRDLSRLYAGYYVAELLGDLTDDYDPHPALFDAAEQTLLALNTEAPVASVMLRFELAALAAVGHLPSLSKCAECGRPVEAVGRVPFGLAIGGVLCSVCRPGKKQVVSVSAGVLRAMQHYANLESDSWRRIVLDRATLGELRGVLNSYLFHVLGHRPRMHEYLGALTS